MDSKVVSKAIATQVWPAMEELGFSRRSTRIAWRDHEDRIDVIHFRSFNSHEAGVLGVTASTRVESARSS